MFSSVLLPTGELQCTTLHLFVAGTLLTLLLVVETKPAGSLVCRLGFRCLRKLSRVFTGQRFELGTSNILPSDSSGPSYLSNHLDDFWMRSGCETHSNVALEAYSEEPKKVQRKSPTFSVRPRSSVGRVTVDLIRRSWVRFPPSSKDFFFASCGSLFPFTRANAQWVIHWFN